jgi:hypothetical protein
MIADLKSKDHPPDPLDLQLKYPTPLLKLRISGIFLQVPAPARAPSSTTLKARIMTLTREAITKSVSDRLDMSKGTWAKAVEITFGIIKKT